MGSGSKLEVLKNGQQHFKEVSSSKINNGLGGTIFQAKNGDLYVMGIGTSLQVLKQGATDFVNVPSSKITNGVSGTIFQASNGDLYVMANGSKLEVLKQGATKFIDASNSNITNGAHGTIFQASNGDLYVMGKGTRLQVLKNREENFEEVRSSNIINGDDGTIFQASNGDLYAMGKGTRLQVLKNGEENFEEVRSSDITNDAHGTIFQAKNGDLYVMAYRKSLQVLKQGATDFVNVPSSMIINGASGTIFQASNGDLYAMGWGSGLQVLKNNLEFKITHQEFFSQYDGIIKVKNFINVYSKLQYKNSINSKWIDFPSSGKITNLEPETYNFQWIGKNGEAYKDDSFVVNLPDQIIKTFIVVHSDIKIQTVTDETVISPFKKENVKYQIVPTQDDLNYPTQSDFSFKFKEATPINDAGQSSVTYIVDIDPTVEGTTTKTITFVVNGFQTKADAISEADTRIQVVTDETTTLPSKKENVKYGIVPTNDDFNFPTQSGFSFKFASATPINDAGQSSVTYIVDIDPTVVGTTTKIITFVVNGFQTKVDAISEVDTRIQAVTDETATLPSKKESVKYGIVPTNDDFNSPTQSKFSFKFASATPINDAGQSSVTYIVDIDPAIIGTTPKEITFTIGDFETKVLWANARINAVSNKTATAPTKKKIVKYIATPAQDDLNSPIQKGFSFIFVSATPINNQGKSTITYTVDLAPEVIGTTAQNINFIISGFQIKDTKVKINNLKIILTIFTSIGLISLVVIIWWTNRFFFKFKSMLQKNY